MRVKVKVGLVGIKSEKACIGRMVTSDKLRTFTQETVVPVQCETGWKQ